MVAVVVVNFALCGYKKMNRKQPPEGCVNKRKKWKMKDERDGGDRSTRGGSWKLFGSPYKISFS
jgi:hypothetical protein